jgi:hypothetical protein
MYRETRRESNMSGVTERQAQMTVFICQFVFGLSLRISNMVWKISVNVHLVNTHISFEIFRKF